MLSHYRWRIVTEWNHLIERTAVIDADLDDFIFELVKAHVWLALSVVHVGPRHFSSGARHPRTLRRSGLSLRRYRPVCYNRACSRGQWDVSKALPRNLHDTRVIPFPNGEWVVVTQQIASDRLHRPSTEDEQQRAA